MSLHKGNIRDVLLRVAYLYREAPEELKDEYAKVVKLYIAKANEILGKESETEVPPEAPPPAQAPPIQSQVPEIARELWQLARGNPDIFQAYARSYPNDELQTVANNPTQLNQLMNQINNTQSEVTGAPIDNIPPAPARSSNVFGFRYDPLKQNLAVRFHDGSVYRYSQVPKVIWDMFKNGEGICRTSGSNHFGRWWRGKTNPSYGAAVHQLLIAGKFPYQKIR